MGKKWVISDIINFYMENDCEPIDFNSYSSNKQIIKYKCSCGKVEEMKFKAFLVHKQCYDCLKKNSKRVRKYNFNDVLKTFQEYNLTLISTEYIDNHSLLKYICSCNQESEISYKRAIIKKPQCYDCGKEQAKQTNIEKYGNACNMNINEVKEKIKNRTEDQIKESNKKREETNIEKYGFKYVTQRNEIKNKAKQTNLERYGVEHVLQSSSLRNKIKEQNLSKHGVESLIQLPTYFKKIQNSSAYKYTLPSGNIIKLHGYEDIAMDKLLKTYTESDIITDCELMPVIWYESYERVNINSHQTILKKRRYFPDFYIPKENLILEIKSTYTYNKELFKNKLKAIFTRKLGYNYETWIINRNGVITYI